MAEAAAAPRSPTARSPSRRRRPPPAPAPRAARQAEAGGEAFVTISPAAADYIRASAAEQGRPEGVRLRILAGGCSGLEYKLDLLEPGETAGAGDREVVSNGVTMLMDLKSAIHVTGSVIDYEDGPAAPRLPHQQPERHLHLLLRGQLRRLSGAGGLRLGRRGRQPVGRRGRRVQLGGVVHQDRTDRRRRRGRGGRGLGEGARDVRAALPGDEVGVRVDAVAAAGVGLEVQVRRRRDGLAGVADEARSPGRR